jgi:dipeptidase D
MQLAYTVQSFEPVLLKRYIVLKLFFKITAYFVAFALTLAVSAKPISPSELSQKTAEYAAATYSAAMVQSLAELVKHDTQAVDGISATKNPAHIAFKAELKKQALALGLDFKDEGYLVVIGLGDSEERLGVITHGDIQPYNASKWQKSPLILDATSEPGNLIGRGTEDDKGPISTALYAMKAIKDKRITLKKRIELYVYMAEESDWAPLQAYVKENELPAINITIDANYPVVTAEKGWGLIKLAFSSKETGSDQSAVIRTFTGGSFVSQIPEDAQVVISNVSPELHQHLKERTNFFNDVSFSFENEGTDLTITALGKSAHSSKPDDGKNAITHLAALLQLENHSWPNNGAGTLVNFINDNIGLDLEGKNFGNIAYKDDFMGPMTVAPTVITQTNNGPELSINLRRPKGKSKTQLLAEIDSAITHWQGETGANVKQLEHYIGEPFIQTDAPQVETLLSVFRHFTGIKDAKPVSIGGSTNSQLFPTAVSFGPTMPGKTYTGHSEHEFITFEQFVLNLKMYTAAFIELAK